MNTHRFRLKFIGGILICSLFYGCGGENEFLSIGDNISKKLIALGDCNPPMKDAEYFIVETEFDTPNLPALFQHEGPHTLYCHSLNIPTLQSWEDSIHWRIRKELNELNCGDGIVFRTPLHAVNRTFLCAYKDCPIENENELVEIQLKLLKTFDEKGFRTYLQHAAQHDEMTESEAVELLLMNHPEKNYQKHGDCFIETLVHGTGDSITSGNELSISYTTHLLDGTQLDEPTDFQFSYGRPGQIVDGLHYALSLMRKGDESVIYLPSKLAFGINGSGSGGVPPKTPVYFKLKIDNEFN